jgi:hypothetical protein
MNRIILAFIAATGMSLAAPASALSFQVDFPTLTYPTPPTPDTSQGCANLNTLSGETCTAPAK